jgi:hypothetical protein
MIKAPIIEELFSHARTLESLHLNPKLKTKDVIARVYSISSLRKTMKQTACFPLPRQKKTDDNQNRNL